jgi:hypothetical protein
VTRAGPATGAGAGAAGSTGTKGVSSAGTTWQTKLAPSRRAPSPRQGLRHPRGPRRP